MFGWFRQDPVAAARKEYAAKLQQAKDAERMADRALQGHLYAEAEALLVKLTELERQRDAAQVKS